MLKLVKTDIAPMLEQRVVRMEMDAHLFRKMSIAEIRAVYPYLERTRDALSEVLDRADGKHV